MDIGLSIAAGALTATEQGVSVYANDIANQDTVAFTSQTPLFTGLPATLAQKPATGSAVTGAAPELSIGAGVELCAGSASGAEGAITPTGVPTDVAISGPGYFAVATPAGTAYTRDGSFSVDAGGHLVNQEGYLVLSTQGRAITVPVAAAQTTTIDAKGVVSAGGRAVATLGIASVKIGRAHV